MQKNNIIKNAWTNVYVRNLVYALAVLIVLVCAVKIFLDVFTRHGESEPVPDFVGMKLDSVKILAHKTKLRTEIVDSVFRYDFPKGCVSRQNPEAGTPVKKNRKIYLTINSLSPRKEAVPDVVGCSLRDAMSMLGRSGFRVGKLNYVYDDKGTNNVLEQMYGNRKIEPGVLLQVGANIDLKLTLVDSVALSTLVPNVVGFSFERAINSIVDNSLNYELHYDRSVKNIADSLNSTVYKQDPLGGEHLHYGANVNIYLRVKR
ncbi:MAG: PASTA domain-containing protein [Prevotellaceae bacterium]|jgi:beta-lactam-binding protein with PASTA domain|nr:PASTA domain-containing protein [Prevotellaceae bacterium]